MQIDLTGADLTAMMAVFLSIRLLEIVTNVFTNMIVNGVELVIEEMRRKNDAQPSNVGSH